jgi:hypothetical protein
MQLKIWQANIVSNIMQNILALEYYYSRQAAKCPDLLCTSFLVYVASEKKRQIMKLQEFAGFYSTDIFTRYKAENQHLVDLLDNLSDKTLGELFDYIKELSIRDLKMYAILLNGNIEFDLIFSALIDIEEDYMTRIESGYLDHFSIGIAKTYKEDPEKVKTMQLA